MSPKKYIHPKPSVFTPFFRRFTDERAAELSDTIALYNDVRAQYHASHWSNDDAHFTVSEHIWQLINEYNDIPENHSYLLAVYRCLGSVLDLEKPIFETPEVDFDVPLTMKELVDLRRFLRAQQYFLSHDDKVIEKLTDTLYILFSGLIHDTPDLPNDALFNIPLIYTLPQPALIVSKVIGTLDDDIHTDYGLFTELTKNIYENVCQANNLVPYTEHKKPFKDISTFDLPPLEIIDLFFDGTPFVEFFRTPVPLPISQETRFEHSWIVAGSGHGKTQTLQFHILEDLKRVAKGEASVVVIDSQGDLIHNISSLKRFADGEELHDKLVLIDPTDIEYPVALNLFDVGMERINKYSPLDRERLINGVLELYDFVLASLLSAELTQKQSVVFRYITRLMLHIPNATIHTFRELMDVDGYEKYRSHISKLKGTARAFFETEFNSRQFEDTKRQIVRRLWGILENQTFERMFSHPRNKLDLFTEMNSGKVILINTAKELLKQNGCEIFGRFFIAMIAQAAQERATLEQRMPTFVYIDECQDYMDHNVALILEQARKYKIGMILAHQYLGQLEPRLQQSFAANTSIKFAGGVSDKDARAFAGMLRTKPDFIESQKKGSFAAFIRNVTDTAVPLSFPFGVMEKEEKMSDGQRHALRAEMRAKYATPYSEVERHISERMPEQPTSSDPDDADTISRDW